VKERIEEDLEEKIVYMCAREKGKKKELIA
jgi:hypothetical protein